VQQNDKNLNNTQATFKQQSEQEGLTKVRKGILKNEEKGDSLRKVSLVCE